jgi:cell division protease FtsH
MRRMGWWNIPLVVLLLLGWREMSSSLVKTIDYSEFQEHLAKGEVDECKIDDSDITGRITLKQPPPEGAAAKEKPPAEAKAATNKKAATKNNASANEKAAAKEKLPAKEAEKSHPPASPEARAKAVGALLAKATEGPQQAEAEAAAKSFEFRTTYGGEQTLPALQAELKAAKIKKYSYVKAGVLGPLLLGWVLPLVVIGGLMIFLSRGLRNAGQAVMGFGRSKARVAADTDTGVTFDDVAGCDEAKYELSEVVDFLKNPSRYTILGAKIPKGILLIGPPGTGKTLLARAVAGEAGVPFFSISGSEFVEMFVGVGASRVRDLFEQAKAQAPCIVFIDELDAIGRERGVHLGPVNDEREQTLNQLLVEMDGFQANAGVILLAATNRPEILDRALLRPGRFDRQVVVDAPDMEGRWAILKVHARGKPLAAGTDLRKIAQGTPGLSGADLANALNEAALMAARRKEVQITQRDLEEAVEKVVAGPERKSRRLDEKEKRRVAYHEVGHALVATFSRHSDLVHKISIIPRGRAALGYTLQLPEAEQFLLTRSELLVRIRGMLGGRAAEEVVFNEVSTGAENDLDHATILAQHMVCLYGMSDAVGLIHCGQRPDFFPLRSLDGAGRRDCSPETSDQIDREVKRLLDTAYEEAKAILQAHRRQLDTVAAALFERESLDRAGLLELLGDSVPGESAPEEPAPAAK